MAGGYGKALVVMVVVVFMLAAFYGAIAPALQPLFSFIDSSAALGSGSPFGPNILADYRFVLFILGPMLLLLAGILLPIVVALRREVSTARR